MKTNIDEIKTWKYIKIDNHEEFSEQQITDIVKDILDNNIEKENNLNKKILKKIVNNILLNKNDLFMIESHLLYYIFSKHSWELFYRWLKKVIPAISLKINLLLAEIINDKLKESNIEWISDNDIQKEVLEIKKIMLEDNTPKWFIWKAIVELQWVYRSWMKVKENWKTRKKTTKELSIESKIKDNIRYLFGQEKLEMSFENLFKIFQKYLK